MEDVGNVYLNKKRVEHKRPEGEYSLFFRKRENLAPERVRLRIGTTSKKNEGDSSLTTP